MRKTKIICTLGPASENSEVIRQMIEAGTDLFRLNMSHARHDWVREIVPRVRALAQQLDRDVALLLDTQGPAIRTGVLTQDLPLAVGDVLEITVRGAQSTELNSINVNYDDLIDDVSVGDVILVDNATPGLEDAVKSLRAIIPQNADSVAIIAISANASEKHRKQCEAAGFNGFLSKPLDKDAMLALLAANLPTHEAGSISG